MIYHLPSTKSGSVKVMSNGSVAAGSRPVAGTRTVCHFCPQKLCYHRFICVTNQFTQ